MKKLLALLMAAAMLVSFSACNGNDDGTTTTEPSTVAAQGDTQSDLTSANGTTNEGDTTKNGETTKVGDTTKAGDTTKKGETTKKGSTTKTSTQNTADDPANWSTAKIVEYYKTAAKKSSNVTSKQTMALVSLDGGPGAAGALINMLKGTAEKALAKNSTEYKGITGGYEKLSVSDLKSAKAYKSGDNIVIEMTMKDQTDGPNGKSKEGTVGHAISVLDGVEVAIKELGADVDYSNGQITIKYTDAKLNVTVNKSGVITKGNWSNMIHANIKNTKLSFGILSATLKDTKGVISYKVTIV